MAERGITAKITADSKESAMLILEEKVEKMGGVVTQMGDPEPNGDGTYTIEAMIEEDNYV